MSANATSHPSSPPPFSCSVTATEEETVVRCFGELTYEAVAGFKARVKPLLAETNRLVLDFAEVDYMDSAGLGVLVTVYTSAKAAGRDFQLINIQPQVYDRLRMTRLLAIFGLPE